MNLRLLNIVIVLIAFVVVSCGKLNPVEREEEQLKPFDQIELNSSFDLYLTEGTEYSIRIVADEKIVEDVSYTISDSTLVLDNDRKFKWTTPTKNKIEVYITSPPLKTITSNKTCFIRTLTPITSDEFGMIFTDKANNADLELDCDVFYYWNNYPCGGTLTLRGQCNWLKLWNAAIVDVQAKELQAKQAVVENNSKGDCVVNVSDFLSYKIEGEGNIEVYGSPLSVEEFEPSTGSGELISH